MIALTYVDSVDGPIFKKTRVILSTGWPIKIDEIWVATEQELRIALHRLGVKDWRVEDIKPQNYAERKIESMAYALASEIVLYGCDQIEVKKENGSIFLQFSTQDQEYHSLELDPNGYVSHSLTDLPDYIESLLTQYYTEYIMQG